MVSGSRRVWCVNIVMPGLAPGTFQAQVLTGKYNYTIIPCTPYTRLVCIRDLECPGIIDEINLILRNMDRQHPTRVHAPLKSLFSYRHLVRRLKQFDRVSLLDRKHDPTRVNDNHAIGRFLEGDDTKRFRCSRESVGP